MSVYLAARDLAGSPLGTHQFIIVVNKSNPYLTPVDDGKCVQARPLGGMNQGYVVGAQNRGNLVVEFFEPSDYQATREFFDPNLVKIWKSDFDTEAHLVDFGKTSVHVAVVKLFRLIDNFILN